MFVSGHLRYSCLAASWAGRAPRRRAPLCGTTTVELIVAMVVLATAAIGVGRFASTTGQGLRDRELSARIGWELVNAREQIGAWRPADISVERIEELSFSAALAQNLDDLHWQATVTPMSEPTQALRVTLTLHCTFQGQAAQPAALVFWVAAPLATPEDPPAALP